ncbi:mitochondrial ATP-independent inner membrane protease subunit 1a-like [Magnolia sinica]|uniref:mitochondrial ATP-independent inner membrane protease subunit 1a-like n=1 Tax=Magnolia sinica TaxID=86752 RepID=UPI00265888C1|nr:mitochondrial ATP-independent inner membrane protease subunit 1a-like [Magnolia sinica]XP_058095286.1 mitochondrial ATP-independent inner membrane protease subunit 1a-like [Magnolia sinica]
MGRLGNIIERMRDVPWRSVAKEAADRSFIVAKFLCFCHVTNNYLCSIALVYGPSMLPTINLTGDLVLVDRVSHRIGHVGLGDIVLLRSPENPRKTVTKRITGMEGDTVTFAVDPKQGDRWKTVIVPKGHIFVQGDNIFSSNDSRNFGAVPYALVQAKALIRIWPPSAFGPLG